METTSDSIRRFYDSFAPSQATRGINPRHLSILQWLKRFGLSKHSKVLEIGCGVGTLTMLLARTVTAGSVVAVDISPKSIEMAMTNLRQYTNTTFQVSDMSDFLSSQKFDFIVLPDVLEHIPIESHKQLFKKLSSLLVEDGRIAIHIPNADHLRFLKVHRPDIVQIVDQPLEVSDILQAISGTNLELKFMCDYSVWVQPADYRILILKHCLGPEPRFLELSDDNGTLRSRLLRRIIHLIEPYLIKATGRF